MPVIIDADYLKSLSPAHKGYRQWTWSFYLKGVPGSDLKGMEAKLPNMPKRRCLITALLRAVIYRFVRWKEIYFMSFSSHALSLLTYLRCNDPAFIATMLAIAVLILLFAGINYLNLSVAQSGFRAKSTAIQRLLGSGKRAIFWGFHSRVGSCSYYLGDNSRCYCMAGFPVVLQTYDDADVFRRRAVMAQYLSHSRHSIDYGYGSRMGSCHGHLRLQTHRGDTRHFPQKEKERLQ